jgi:hypothetical protein
MAKKNLFEIIRADGRSNTQVICDYIGSCDPGRIFNYEELLKVLSAGCDRAFTVPALQAAIRIAGPKLGKVHKRTLHNVRTVGYRLAPATEHMALAVDRQAKAGKQLKRGYEILRDVRFDEIKDENARRAHEGQLLIVGALLNATVAQERRIARVEALVNGMLGVVTKSNATSSVER